MSEEKYKLVNKHVTVFTDGGWDFQGIVEHEDETRLILIEDVEPFVIYKSKICAISILLDDDEAEKAQEDEELLKYDRPLSMHSRHEEMHDMGVQDNQMNYEAEQSHYGSIIPSDMLIGDAEKLDDFTINMSSFKTTTIKKK
jgi:sRNA-binding regulator protein Hfq